MGMVRKPCLRFLLGLENVTGRCVWTGTEVACQLLKVCDCTVSCLKVTFYTGNVVKSLSGKLFLTCLYQCLQCLNFGELSLHHLCA